MTTMLVLCDGTEIEPVGEPPQGTRHRVSFGRERGSGAEVVVKIELIDGALEREATALRWLGRSAGVAAPRLRADTHIDWPGAPGAGGRSRRCLVLDRAPGEPPRTTAGWGRLGAALATLAARPWEGSGLPVCDVPAFWEQHEARLDELSRAYPGAIARVRRGAAAGRPVDVDAPLCLTHGDPGPGNFLDAPKAAGTLIDWEEAHVAPRGLDLGRAVVIALLGVGPDGYVARDHAERAGAVADAYLECARSSWAPDGAELRWWLTVAGVQLAHRRHERAGEPGVLPAGAVLDVLVGALERPGFGERPR
jgi:hypothetical protein